jgi:hypothetical protein
MLGIQQVIRRTGAADGQKEHASSAAATPGGTECQRRAAAAEIRKRLSPRSLSERVRAIPAPDGLVRVGGHDGHEIELGQPPVPAPKAQTASTSLLQVQAPPVLPLLISMLACATMPA